MRRGGRGDLLQRGLRGQDAHGAERLADGGEAGVLERGGLHVVEADDRDIAWHMEAGFAQGTNGADGGDVVEGEERGEGLLARQEALGGEIAGLVCGLVAFELGDEQGVHRQAGQLHSVADAGPAGLGVGREALALDECQVAVPETFQVIDGELGGAAVIEQDVGDALRLVVAGDGDGGDGRGVREECVDGDDGLDGALEQEALRALDRLRAMAVADEEVEEVGLEQLVLDAGQHGGGVALADFGDEDAHGLGAAIAEGPGVDVGAVVELAGGREDALLRGLRDGAGGGGGVEHAGDGCGGEAEVPGELLEADGGGRRRNLGTRWSGRRGGWAGARRAGFDGQSGTSRHDLSMAQRDGGDKRGWT